MLATGCGFLGRAEPEPLQLPDAGAAPDAARLDGDLDGIADPDDVCPRVNDPDQRDHDADGIGDHCDPCPHRIDDGIDGDGDGVGDACDPNPAVAGERIAYFEGFYDEVAWKPVIGGDAWTSEGGALHQHATDRDYQLVRDDQDLGDVVVEVRARINQVTGDASARRSMGIVAGYRGTDDYWYCGLAATSGAAGEVNAGKVSFDLFEPFRFNTVGWNAPPIGAYQILRTELHATGDATSIECRVARDALASVATYTTNDDAIGDVGLRTNGADASFDYIFVVVRTP